MRSLKEIKSYYKFTLQDEILLGQQSDLMSEQVDSVMDALHDWMLQLKEIAEFFTDENRKQRVFAAHRNWFLELFSGHYDTRYHERLIRAGQIHVKASLNASYVNMAVNVVRNACTEILSRHVEDREERTAVLTAVGKILDINLDIITSSYIEEELRTYSPAYRVRTVLVSFSERFVQTMNLVLILALMGLTIGVVALFVYDIQKLINGDIDHVIITSLGSLLMLWIMIELMNTEIKHLKGGKFRISVFVGVALVAIIRDTMIMMLKHEQIEKLYYLGALILILGIVFWLVNRAEERSA